MRIITAGDTYMDIDAYAGCVAYAELLQQMDISAQAVSTATLNQSIPPIVREWLVSLQTSYQPSPDNTFTLIDVSNPEYFQSFVDLDHVDEVIDHHPGFKDFWHNRIGDKTTIEHVGAACTQVFEKWQQAQLADNISQTSARLLMCGILDNTLNFGAKIANARDREAYDALSTYAHLPANWPEIYFEACQTYIMQDLADAIINDTKNVKYTTFPRRMAVGQVAIWDAADAIHQSFDVFKSTLQNIQPDWCMNIISIDGNKSYFVSDVPEVRDWFAQVLNVQFDGNVSVADRMWLRKEIMKADIGRSTEKHSS